MIIIIFYVYEITRPTHRPSQQQGNKLFSLSFHNTQLLTISLSSVSTPFFVKQISVH